MEDWARGDCAELGDMEVSPEPEAELSDMEELEGTGEQGEWDGKEEVEKEVKGYKEETMS